MYINEKQNNELTLEQYLQRFIENYRQTVRKTIIEKNDGKSIALYDKFVNNEEVPDAFDSILEFAIESSNQLLLSTFEENIFHISNAVVESENKLRRDLSEETIRILALTRAFIEMCFAICASFYSSLAGTPISNPHQFKALFSINGTSLRILKEVLCLAENGYPEGAFARARTLSEHAAVASFLSQDDDETSKAFLESAKSRVKRESDHYRWALILKKFAGKSADEISISSFMKELNARLQNGIEESHKVSNSKFRKPYDDKSFFVHASAKGILGRFSKNPEPVNTLYVKFYRHRSIDKFRNRRYISYYVSLFKLYTK